MRKILSGRGFTIIELLIVIGVIGALAAGIMTVLNPVTQLQKANDARRKSDLAQIKKALELYYNDNNTYPVSLSFGGSFTPYMNRVPQDSAGRRYAYFVGANGQTYRMYASLERGGNDPQACNPTPGTNGAPCPNASGLSCGSGACNYGATSTDTSP